MRQKINAEMANIYRYPEKQGQSHSSQSLPSMPIPKSVARIRWRPNKRYTKRYLRLLGDGVRSRSRLGNRDEIVVLEWNVRLRIWRYRIPSTTPVADTYTIRSISRPPVPTFFNKIFRPVIAGYGRCRCRSFIMGRYMGIRPVIPSAWVGRGRG